MAIQIGKNIVNIIILIKKYKYIIISNINNVNIIFNIKDTIKIFCNNKYIIIFNIKSLVIKLKFIIFWFICNWLYSHKNK